MSRNVFTAEDVFRSALKSAMCLRKQAVFFIRRSAFTAWPARKPARSRPLEDCMAQILEDVVFYGKSGGGVTLSGGEVLMQKAFAQALLERCHAEGIHTAIESNLCVDTAVLEQLIPQLDLVMADIKSMDAPAHIRGTGCSNEKTLRNIRWLDGRNVPLIIRTPVIPGFNDSEDNIAQTAEFLKSLSNLSYYELLSYNPMGNDKRKRLGYPVPEITALPAARMRELARTAASAGIPVWLNGTQYHNIED